MKKILKYVVIDILRNKIVLAYTIFLLILSFSIFNLEDSSSKGILSLLNIVLIVVPMVSVLFASIYVYNSAEFLELLLSQPLRRKTIWLSVFSGLLISMVISFVAGVGIPVLLYEFSVTGFTLIISGILLTIIFIALAMLVAVKVRDKARGIGAVILLWLYFSILFDGLVLFLLFQFEDYPLEKPMVAITALNPIDLSRIMVLLKMDISAMMGYTGAVFRNFFGNATGMCISLLVLLLWIILPIWISVRMFNRKDV
ncbi:MAG: ABC transporter permease subunit [Bacteroidetes bacterium]|nr:ABC transporter permease subunit [Bacteroidota bacterium]